MLGDKYLVAPVITKENKLTVKLPKGKWMDDQGKVFKGGKEYQFEIPISRLLYFEKK
jgi:Alpha-glucosidases, family 31 of glycosyl hydrolases